MAKILKEFPVKVGMVAKITDKRKSGFGQHRGDVLTSDGKGEVLNTFEVGITSIEDCGEYWYFGFRPLDLDHGSFGASRFYKEEGKRPYGTIKVEDVGREYKPFVPDFNHGWMIGHPGYDPH